MLYSGNSAKKRILKQKLSSDIFCSKEVPQPQKKINKDFNKSSIVFESYEDVPKKKIINDFKPKFEDETPYQRRMKQYYSSSVDTTRYSSTSYGALEKEHLEYIMII
jgi:hypothetical protein